MLKTLSLWLAFLLPLPILAQTLPPGGQSLFDKPALSALSLSSGADKGKMEKVAVKGRDFKEAVRLTTFQSTDNPWGVQVDAVCAKPVKAGDVLFARFWMRAVTTTVESGEANSEFVFERDGDPWTKAASYSLTAGPQWKEFSIPFTAVEDLPAGKSHICFRMGYRPQSFELAGLEVLAYGDRVKESDLPQTKATYPGEEADAPWRKAAQERIDRIRKGDLTVTVTDAEGRPVKGAAVSVDMKRHAFGFGTAVADHMLAGQGPDNDRYRSEVAKLFNLAVFENALKWGPWEDGASNSGYWHRDDVWTSLKWLHAHDIDVRGHNMVWGGWRWLPASIQQLKGDPGALEAAVEKRIRDVGGAMKGQVTEWDVVNEPVNEHDLTDVLGQKAMVKWYKLAHEVDPGARLFVNDYPSPDTVGHLDAYDKIIQYLLDNGAPLQGIGLQGHVGGTPWSIPALLSTLDKLGSHGLPVEITEYDTDIKDPKLAAEFFRDFLTAVFSHPDVEGFLMWGFWDGAHWHHHAPLFNQDWTPKPAEKVYEDLVFHDWWTDDKGTTNAEGSYAVRGFLGDYEVTVTKGSKKAVLPAKLVRKGTELKVVLK